MANPIQFTAQPDQLRKLKAGSSPGLLETWANLVFQGWAWDEPAQDALDRLATHPFLPREGLSQAFWPSVALRDINAVVAGVKAGLDLGLIRPVSGLGSVRATALYENAPPKVHAALDTAGVPGLTLAEVVKLFPASIEKSHHHSFDYLVKNHWETVQLALTPPESSILLAKVLKRFSAATALPPTSPSSGSVLERRFCTHMLKEFALQGLDWGSVVEVVLDGSTQVRSHPALWALLAQVSAERLDRSLPDAEDLPVHAPPRRPRL